MPSTVDPFYQKRSLNQILWEGLKLYKQYGLALTLPLISPYLKIMLGALLWLALPICCFNLMQQLNQPILLAVVFIISNIPGAYLFFGGFWRYLLFLSAQSQMVRQVMELGHVDDVEAILFKVACRGNDYAMMSVILMFIWLLPFLLLLLLTAFFTYVLQNAIAAIIIGVFGFLTSAFLVLIITLFLSLSFQCFMFQPDKLGAVLLHSFELSRRQFWKVALIGFISFMITQNVMPTFFTCLLDWVGIIPILAKPLEPGVAYYISNLSEPIVSAEALAFLKQHTSVIAGAILEINIMLSFALLLIPLGACWYTLLYADLKERHG